MENKIIVKKNSFGEFRATPRDLKEILHLWRKSSGLIVPKRLFDLYAIVHRFGSDYYKERAREFMARMSEDKEEYDDRDVELVLDMLRGYDEICEDIEQFFN